MTCIRCTEDMPENEQWEYAIEYERELLVLGIIALPEDKLCEICAEDIEVKTEELEAN